MNRIDQIFANHAQQGTKALMPYLTMGDPDIQTSARLIHAAQDAGASICELGFPFSDPVADGPTIQASMTWALEHGIKSKAILEMVAEHRSKLDIGLVAMVSYSIVHKIGDEGFQKDAIDSGIDGFIIPDLAYEESTKVRELIAKHGGILSFLIAPTTPEARAIEIAKASSGFIYLLARAGITGEQSDLPPDLAPRVARMREISELPITVGFGVSTDNHVRQVVSVADAAIVGSAIVRRITEARGLGSDAVVQSTQAFMSDLARGLTRAPEGCQTS
ncbi:MAG TPA: tryptophan synthase subunit alpha [Phycisphaerales bacterium]|nr:tryptophan synthase subunit alpha [Phycisphaerales bacterium]